MANSVFLFPGNFTFTGNITFAGTILAANGSASVPSYSFASQPALGFFKVGTGKIGVAGNYSGSVEAFAFDASSAFPVLGLASAASLAWSSTSSGGGTPDVILVRGAANVLEQRNSTTGQTLNIYNTFIDASNYERLRIGWTANLISIIAEGLGTGNSRAMRIGSAGSSLSLRTNGTDRWDVDANGHLLADADNTYDIGALAATRPRTIYAATSFVTAGFVNPASYKVGGVAGASGSGSAITAITVVNGLVTAITVT